MAEYKEIKGKTVQSLASDLDAEGEGQIWYNTTSSDFKGGYVFRFKAGPTSADLKQGRRLHI